MQACQNVTKRSKDSSALKRYVTGQTEMARSTVKNGRIPVFLLKKAIIKYLLRIYEVGVKLFFKN